jgi:adenylate cyclase
MIFNKLIWSDKLLEQYEDLTTDLSHFANLHIISSYTTQKIGDYFYELLSVAGELGIDYLLNGNLRRFKGNIRISAQLIKRRAGNHSDIQPMNLR